MAVILINKTNRMQIFNLDHPHPSIAVRRERKNMVIMEESRSGDRLPRRITKSICPSLTLLAGQRITKFSDGTPLPDMIASVPSIKRAIDAKVVRVVKVAVTAEKPAAAAKGRAVVIETKTPKRGGRPRK